jgi:two-component system, response regulator FlrC
MEHAHVLIVEDDRDLQQALADTMSIAGFECSLASDGKSALETIASKKPHIVVSDIQMQGLDGQSLLRRINKHYPDIPVILITAHADVGDAVCALRNGAVDYLAKPFQPEILVEKISKCLPKSLHSETPIAEDISSKKLLAIAGRVAPTEATVLISGESGCGKEVLARYIHNKSARETGPFVAINCAAIPETMLEATLFGYEKGAFTGAYKSTPGKFEIAQGGTLLLDEISEMDLGLQAKLVRVLQERELERIGGNKTIQLDVRIIATTNRQLLEEVKAKRFREDLYYRLNVFPLKLTPLRERPGDILPLGEYLLAKHYQLNAKTRPQFSSAAKQALKGYTWPGNVREMENVIQRALILQQQEQIEPDDLHLEAHFESSNDSIYADNLTDEVKNHEFKKISEALATYDGNRKKIANALGISERTLRYKLAKMRDLGLAV